MSGSSTRFIAALVVAALIGTGVLALTASASPVGASAAKTSKKKKPAKCKTSKSKSKSSSKKSKHKTCKKKPKKKKPVVVAPPTGGQALVGTFKITRGAYVGNHHTTGSYFRMIQPGGSVRNGPFFPNGSSSAADTTFTLLNPGTDGGLITGDYQSPPNPAFSGTGYALADRIITPTPFVGVNFSVSTSANDPQTKTNATAPAVTDTSGKLTGNVAAWSAEWNGLYFNQGSPKPNGSTPGLTTPVTGTYDESTHAFVLEWASTIVGGPFNSFSGYWHLEGTFVPKATTPAPATGLGSLLPPG